VSARGRALLTFQAGRIVGYAGLGALYTLRDAGAPVAGCGGVSEFPLVLRDVALFPNASLAYPTQYVPEMFGNLSLVNGALWPKHTVPAAPVAYRPVHGCRARYSPSPSSSP
jgi:spore coat protein A